MRLDAMADDTLIDDAALAFDAVSFIPPYNEFTGEPQATAPPFVPSYEKANARPPEDAAPPIADGPPLGGRAVGAPDWSFNGEAATSP